MKGFTKGMFHGGTLVEGREATIYTLNLLISVSARQGRKVRIFQLWNWQFLDKKSAFIVHFGL